MKALRLAILLWTAAAGTAFAQDAPERDFEVDGGALTHHRFGFALSVPDGWSISAGPDAHSKIPGTQAVFARDDNLGRGFLEVQWNSLIDPDKYMEQLVSTYAKDGKRSGGGAVKVGSLRGGQAVFKWRTPDGTPALTILVAAGSKEWKYGFGFSCPESDYPRLQKDFDAVLQSFKTFPPRTLKGWTGKHAVASAGVTVALPDPLWAPVAKGFWAPGDEDQGTYLWLSRDPYAAYALFGSGPADGTNLEATTKRLLEHVAEKNGSRGPKQTKREKVTVAGAAGIRTVYSNTASFPHQIYWVTVVAKGDTLHWNVVWALPDNADALEKEFEVLSAGWAFTP